jgi:hypothetical protein
MGKMYNEFQKKRYLENVNFNFEDNTKEVIIRLFEGAAKIESQEGCDLADFNREQVSNLLKSYNSKSKHYLRLITTHFSYYYTWCLYEDLVDATNIFNAYDYSITKPLIDDILSIDVIRDKYFLREDVLKYLEMIPDIMNKFILYAVFNGIYGNEYEDLTNLRINDLNEIRKSVQLSSGKNIIVDDIFIGLMKRADIETNYYPEGVDSVNRAKKPERYTYDSSYYVIKNSGTGINNQPVSKTVIMNRFRLMQKQIGNKHINGGNIYKNGLINYVKEKFEERDITLRKAILQEELTKKLGYTYGVELQEYINEFGSQMTDRMFRMQVKDVIELYD